MVELTSNLGNKNIVSISLFIISIAGFFFAQIDVVYSLLAFHWYNFGTQIWTLLTFWLVEPNFLVLIGNLLCIHLARTVLEPIWRRNELLRMAIIVNIASIIACVVIIYIGFFTGLISFDVSNYSWSIAGLSAFNAAVFIGVKQMLPDAVLFSTPLGRFKNNNIPFAMWMWSIVLSLASLIRYTVPIQYLIGSLSAYFYLRFYQKHEAGNQGDPEDHFRFASLFPSPMHRAIEKVSNVAYKLALKAGVIKPSIRRMVDLRQMTSSSSANAMMLNIANDPDAERRKQKAIKDLEERMKQPMSPPPTSPVQTHIDMPSS